MKLSLGFSPCPNDTFIFDAMVHGKVDTEGLEFEYFLADVEELNKRAFAGDVDITKISYHAYARASENYLILDSGSALGRGNGPLLITRKETDPGDIENKLIAIPGIYTTANLLLSLAWPKAARKREYVFSEIEQAVITGEVDAGLIIHESRFTYHTKGLKKIADMGAYWEGLTGLPIPLGGIVINRKIENKIAEKVNRILSRSIDYATTSPDSTFNFVRENAQEMDEDVVQKHIGLYVNEFTADLGPEGKMAVRRLLEMAGDSGLVPRIPERIFISGECY